MKRFHFNAIVALAAALIISLSWNVTQALRHRIDLRIAYERGQLDVIRLVNAKLDGFFTALERMQKEDGPECPFPEPSPAEDKL